MAEHQGATDQEHEIQLDSAIDSVVWGYTQASVGDEVPLEVRTHFVGSGSEVRITVRNNSGRRLDRFTGTVRGNRYSGKYTVSDEAEEAIYFEAELRQHGLSERSENMEIIPPIIITNLQWSQQEARRGDILQLTADVEGAYDGADATIKIYEHDADGAHDPITEISAMVENGRIEVEWMYEYYDDTDEIPTEAELEQGYSSPEYFFRVIIGSSEVDSELLEFKDWIEFTINNSDGEPEANVDYILHLPDDQERRGTLDDQGYTREEDIPPGPCQIELLYPESTDSDSE